MKIWHSSHVLPDSKIGNKCSIGQNVVIGPDVAIGSGCKIQNNVSVYKGVTLEDNVFCGPSVVFTNVVNPRAEIRRMSEIKSTLVKKGATLGANSTIVCGHSIGRYAFIAAGAVVTKDVDDRALMAEIMRGKWAGSVGAGISSIRSISVLKCVNMYKLKKPNKVCTRRNKIPTGFLECIKYQLISSPGT